MLSKDWRRPGLDCGGPANPAEFSDVALRQQAIAELRGNHALRESLAEAARTNRGSFEGKALKRWLDESPVSLPLGIQITSMLLAALNVVAVFLALAGRVTPEVPLITLISIGILTAMLWKKLGPVIKSADSMVIYELELLRSYSRTIGSHAFHGQLLRRDQDSLRLMADTDLTYLPRRVKLMRWHEDSAFAYLSYLSLWGMLWAMAVEKHRRRLRDVIQAAAVSIGEIEGLSSLAAFSFEHSDYCFPTLLDGTNDHVPVFRAVGMGHPLIEPSVCVRNPASIDSNKRFVLVSGSNMSGKSTYLRSVGLNFVLARAGAPVCCYSLHISCFSLATSMRVQDSLQDGKSRFMAEVARVREIVDHSKSGPLLFLLDELLGGTNSEDRRAGTAGLVARLLNSGASGFLTTHDLALVEIVFSRPDIAKNVYFVDHFSDDQLAFDYRLRDGILPHSNGAAILRFFGIL